MAAKSRFAQILNYEIIGTETYVEKYLEYAKEKSVTDKENAEQFTRRIEIVSKKGILAQEDVGLITNCDKATVGRWIAETAVPKADDIIAISKVLDISADYLLGIKETKNEVLNSEIQVFEKYGINAKAVVNLNAIRKAAYEKAAKDGAVQIVIYERFIRALNCLLSQEGDELNSNMPPVLMDIGLYLYTDPFEKYYYDSDDFDMFIEDIESKSEMDVATAKDILTEFKKLCPVVSKEEQRMQQLDNIRADLMQLHKQVNIQHLEEENKKMGNSHQFNGELPPTTTK